MFRGTKDRAKDREQNKTKDRTKDREQNYRTKVRANGYISSILG